MARVSTSGATVGGVAGPLGVKRRAATYQSYDGFNHDVFIADSATERIVEPLREYDGPRRGSGLSRWGLNPIRLIFLRSACQGFEPGFTTPSGNDSIPRPTK